jgi:hypothetical protein
MRFWNLVDEAVNRLNQKKFPTLTKLVFAALTIPQSSASVERLFSRLNRLKDRDANRYLLQIATGRMLAAQLVKREGCCVNYTPSDSLIHDIVNGKCRERYFSAMRVRKEEKEQCRGALLSTADVGEGGANITVDNESSDPLVLHIADTSTEGRVKSCEQEFDGMVESLGIMIVK